MIQIERGPCPKILQESRDKTRYGFPEVRDALNNMQYSKCCYCEQNIAKKKSEQEVEHFFPRSLFPEKTNLWENLLLACSGCNKKKRAKFPIFRVSNPQVSIPLKHPSEKKKGDIPAILDPSNKKINPEKHLSFDFTKTELDDYFTIIQAKESLLGENTIEVLVLDSKEHTDLRNEYLFEIFVEYMKLIQALRNLQKSKKDSRLEFFKKKLAIYKMDFETLMEPSAPYANMVRSFARFKKLDQPPLELRIP